MSGYKLLLTLPLEDGSPTKDSGNGLGGVLVGRALALVSISALAVFGLVIIALWPFRRFTAEGFVQASALSHGVLSVLVDRTWTVHELGIVGVVGALSAGIDSVDGVIRPVAAALSASQALRAVFASMLMVILVLFVGSLLASHPRSNARGRPRVTHDN
jgi:flagellar biogenesis protein FliO